MDSMVAAAARALASGDPLGALSRVALRDDPPALALRGIAMAQLGEHSTARALLRRAARGFGSRELVARARCVVAAAEVALATRDLGDSHRALAAAANTLEAHGDHANAQHARLIAARRLLLLGRLGAAEAALSALDPHRLPASMTTVLELTAAELALRTLRFEAARAALTRARTAAARSRVPALLAEAAEASATLDRPVARRSGTGEGQTLRLDEVAALLASDALVIDACRRGVQRGPAWRPLARRPVLFELARALADAAPGDVDRQVLIERVFRTRRPDESHRARLRVELSRLRETLKGLARIDATARGFVLAPCGGGTVVVLAPPIEGDQASLLALLADGVPWSTSALALALGASQRTVQRALVELEAAGSVRSIGEARARRWLSPPLTGFATTLLLPAALPPG